MRQGTKLRGKGGFDAGRQAPVIRDRKISLALTILFLTNTANIVDRQIVNILAEPIKLELKLADWQLGMLTGLAFALFYTILGIPIARYADRPDTDRSRLIAMCLAMWSGMTVICSFAGNYLQLLAARTGVAVGEAGCTPAAHSLITDMVTPQKRSSALAIFSAGTPVGKLLGLIAGGLVAHHLGWRMAFLLIGAPGLLLALLSWFILPEPRRTEERRPITKSSLRAAVIALLPIRSFWLISLAAGFIAFLTYGQTAFLGSFFIRVHQLNVAETGLVLGLAIGGGGVLGAWLGGRLADTMAKRDVRAYMLIPAIGVALSTLIFAGAALASSLSLAIMLLTLASAACSVWYGPTFAAVQGVVPTDQRATGAAIHLFILNIIGIGVGPVAFGILSDLLNNGFTIGGISIAHMGPGEGLRLALIIGSSSGLLAMAAYLMACRTFAADSQR